MSLKENLESKLEAEETANQPAPVDEENTEDSTVDENDSKQHAEAEESEAAVELKRLKKKLELAENKIVKMKKTDEDTQQAETDIESIKAELREEIQTELRKDKVEALVTGLSNDDDEAQLVRFHLENSIKPSGDAEEDVRRAKALADAKSTEASKQAMREVLQAERTKKTAPTFSGRKVAEDKQPNYTAAEKKLLSRFAPNKLNG